MTKPEPKVYSIDPKKIFVDKGRQRQFFNPKALTDLANSIKYLGQIMPILCKKGTSGPELIAGERRLLACETIGIDVKFILEEEATDLLTLERIQLEENLIRENLDWKEEVQAKKRIFDILNESTEKKSIQSVGEYLGVSKSALSEDITLAIWIAENDEVAAAPNKTTAKKIVKRLSTMVVRDRALDEKILEAQKESSSETISVDLEGSSKGSKPAEDSLEPTFKASAALSLDENKILYYDAKCILGSMEEKLLAFPDNHFDIVFFDPPWGVAYDAVRVDVPRQQNYNDSLAEFQKNFPERLKLIYRKMSENSHLYIFFGMIHYEFVYETIRSLGFKTSGIPLLWNKTGARRTRTPEWDYARAYEPIAFVRKGLKKLNFPPIGNVISTPIPRPSLKDIHPSTKHPELYKKLLVQSGFPGDRVLDPTAGSGMLGVAAEELQSEFSFDWTHIEIDEDFRNLQLLNLSKGYTKLLYAEDTPEDIEALALSEIAVDPTLVKDFKIFAIGSDNWKLYWKAHPEQQDEMLSWKAEQGKTQDP